MKFLSLITALCIILTSCNLSESSEGELPPSSSEAIAETEVSKEKKDFFSLDYVRPDLIKITEEIKPLLSMTVTAYNESEALSSFKQAFGKIDDAAEMGEIAAAKYLLDFEQRENQIEITYWINNMYYLDLMKYNLLKAANASPHRDYLNVNLTPREKSLLKEYSAIIPLSKEDSVDLFSALFNLFSRNFCPPYSFSTCLNNFLSNKAEENELIIPAENIFYKIISLRKKGAAKTDYKNYRELLQSTGSYSLKEVNMLISYIKEYLLPLFKKYEPDLSRAEFKASNLSDLIGSARDISPLIANMLEESESLKTIHLTKSEKSAPAPGVIYLNSLSLPFICYSPENSIQTSLLNRLIGKSAYMYCNDGVDNTLAEICGFIFDELSRNSLSDYGELKILLFLSMLSEFYDYAYSEEDLEQKNLRKEFDMIYSQYFEEKEQSDNAYYLALVILSLGSNPFDSLIGAAVSMDAKILSRFDNLYCKNIYSSLLVTGESSDLKETLKSAGLNSPFAGNTIKKIAENYGDNAVYDAEKSPVG